MFFSGGGALGGYSGNLFFDIATSKSGPKLRCFVHFDFEMCFAPQRRATFHHLASWFRTRRFSEPTFRPSGAPNHWKNTVFRDFPTFSRISIFFLLTLSLLLFFLLIFLFSLPLPCSAFHLSILSEVWLRNFLRQLQLQLQLHYTTLHPAVVVRWPLQSLQPLQKTQLQPPVGPSVDSLCHPWFTTTNLSYRLPIFLTSATALCGTTGIYYISHHYIPWYPLKSH